MTFFGRWCHGLSFKPGGSSQPSPGYRSHPADSEVFALVSVAAWQPWQPVPHPKHFEGSQGFSAGPTTLSSASFQRESRNQRGKMLISRSGQ